MKGSNKMPTKSGKNLKNYALGLTLHSEEDVKVKVVLKYLKDLGYKDSDLRFENPITVQVGSKKQTLYSDIEVLVDGRPEIVIDVKNPAQTLKDADLLQAASYAKLVDKSSALYAFATNGIDLQGINVVTGQNFPDIPQKSELIAQLSKRPKIILTEIQLHEVKSTLITILKRDELYRAIKSSKEIIEKQALIRSDQSFREMTKILLIKMNEERRARKEGKENRFYRKWLDTSAAANGITRLEMFKALFKEAVSKYPGIYNDGEPDIQIRDEDAILKVVDLLEPYSFLGTGNDIKGEVYEIFLKNTLRGEFDQYFTPRELVDYIVNSADPQIDECFVDPAAGSGGFLIKSFQHVNDLITASGMPIHDRSIAEQHLVEKQIWGQEADYDLHVLAKINLIMHGDGWNNIYQGDSLLEQNLPKGHFDLVLENPPFTIEYKNKNVLENYTTAYGKQGEELDILFVELSLRLLKPGGRMYIILPEGLLNLPAYISFREWLLSEAWITQTVSLPEGAFQPFGRSASKTCILAVVKKGKKIEPPKYVFGAIAKSLGYETGKATYKQICENDLPSILKESYNFFEGVHEIGTKGSLTAWCKQEAITSYRCDAGIIINDAFSSDGGIKLGDLFDIDTLAVTISDNKQYKYLEVPWISDISGCIQRVDTVTSEDLNASRFHVLNSSDIYFTRINPRKKRIGIVPSTLSSRILVSGEVFTLKWKQNKYLPFESRYAIIPILRSDVITRKICALSTGSSSSRARISADELKKVVIPLEFLDNDEKLAETSDKIKNANDQQWSSITTMNGILNSAI